MAESRRAEVDAATADMNFEANDYQVEFTTSMGTILVDLWADVAPGHAKNLYGLAKIGFYDGIIAHRIISGFVVQIGCPLGTGTGDAGYKIDQEFNAKPHEAGVLSMARSTDPNSGGSQFFLCLGRIPHLDNQYTVFGKTADQESLDVVLEMGQVATGAGDRPLEDVTVLSTTVYENPKG